MNTGLINHKSAIKFIKGGNSLFTIKNPKTENRFTYKVKKHKTDDVYFVKVLTGSDQFSFIGIITKDTVYKHSKKSKISSNAKSVQVISYILEKLKSENLLEFIEIWHEGRCARCSRILTVPESIDSGFGPECIKKIKKNDTYY